MNNKQTKYMRAVELLEEIACLLRPLEEPDPEAWREEYRKKQADGVKFEFLSRNISWVNPEWVQDHFRFEDGNKEDYREAPQEVSASECQKALEHLAKTYSADKGTAQLNPSTPHAAERALWKAQREAGTNEVWQLEDMHGEWCDVSGEPAWVPEIKYRVKPMKLTAKIVRIGKRYPMSYTGHCWTFFGTREEYRAECKKDGCAVVGEIKEVVENPKTVKYYFALCICKPRMTAFAITDLTAMDIQRRAKNGGFTIIGDIEEREIEA